MGHLIPYFYTHGNFTQGGRKCHIGYYEDGIPLCKLNRLYTTSDVKVDENWIVSGIHSNDVCIKCAKKAIEILESEIFF